MPTITPRKDAKDGTKKFACEYGANEGQVTIWYKEASMPTQSAFGNIVKALRLARELVDHAVTCLQKQPDSALVKKVLDTHFGGANGPITEASINQILGRFQDIQKGLSGQVILCVSKKLGEKVRGETTKQMHLHMKEIANDADLDIARTIIHEASHMFAAMPGDNKYHPEGPHEVYAHDEKYTLQKPIDAKLCADSYAWAAVSLSHKHVLTPNELHERVV